MPAMHLGTKRRAVYFPTSTVERQQSGDEVVEAEDRNRLGLFDTCPRDMPVVRTTPNRGQVLNKPRGRKPRRTSRCRSKLWRLQACGSAAMPTLIDAQARCDGTRGRDAA